ncbi:pirin family protein [Serratia marcescens]|uniref:pirin family protein n=1 Tax=Serratia marcescens TaxID=615 RepID=UPI0013DA9C36|nr:pirin family protein [Serratia marcescens]
MVAQSKLRSRSIVLRTRGQQYGPITRLVSPNNIGELIKPFVFLDSIQMESTFGEGFGWHPHSGIATLTIIYEGDSTFEESTGKKGEMHAGDIEWMLAGGGVWHTAAPLIASEQYQRVRGYQLWLALPPQLENTTAHSVHIKAADILINGPARVILGKYGDAHSSIDYPANITYLDVSLKAGEHWSFKPEVGQNVAWVAIQCSEVQTIEKIAQGELVVFAESDQVINFLAITDTRFVLGSAEKHPFELVLGHYSVHTSVKALEIGEAGIRMSRSQLQRSAIIDE